jgi:hypothetical protein
MHCIENITDLLEPPIACGIIAKKRHCWRTVHYAKAALKPNKK